jgi:general secretion pathway protein A
MYESHFNMKGLPFQLSPDPSFYFPSTTHASALAFIKNRLDSIQQSAVVSGEIGAGKTTLVRTFVNQLNSDCTVVAEIVSTQLSFDDLLQAICTAFGILEVEPNLFALEKTLVSLQQEKKRVILIIDEAQNLNGDALQLLAQLVKLRSSEGPYVQLLILGQPDLRDRIRGTQLSAAIECSEDTYHLGPLSSQETTEYIEHRLKKVGWEGRPSFDHEAYTEIFRRTAGIPRRINRLCNRLILSASLKSVERISLAAVGRIADELSAEVGETSQTLESMRFPETAKDLAQRASEVEITLQRPFKSRKSIGRGPIFCIAEGYSDHSKAAPLLRALAGRLSLPKAHLLRIFDDEALHLNHDLYAENFELPSVLSLGLQSENRNQMTAQIMSRFDPLLDKYRPTAIIVMDGGKSALSCSILAKRRGIQVIHINAGRREGSADNASDAIRVMIDHLADILYTSSEDEEAHLATEGIPTRRVHRSGPLMVDAVFAAKRISRLDGTSTRIRLQQQVQLKRGYGLVAILRAANLHEAVHFQGAVDVLKTLSRDLPLIWPLAGPAAYRLQQSACFSILQGERVFCLSPRTFPDYVDLISNATCVLTDSWSVQESAASLHVPCLTIGSGTAAPMGASTSSDRFVGSSTTAATRAIWEIVFSGSRPVHAPALWDGRTALRIASHLAQSMH